MEIPELPLANFRQTDTFWVALARKGKERRLDARPLVDDLSKSATGAIQLILASEPGTAGIKPLELLAAVLGLSTEEIQRARVLKVWTRKKK
jgi:hypothetical protein